MHTTFKKSQQNFFKVSAEIPNSQKAPRLYEHVKDLMIHRKCGPHSSDGFKKSCCLKKGSCRFYFPKQYQNSTKLSEESYPFYRRRSPENGGHTVNIKGHTYTNEWVATYNPWFLMKYSCHINVEMCWGITVVKYVYK